MPGFLVIYLAYSFVLFLYVPEMYILYCLVNLEMFLFVNEMKYLVVYKFEEDYE